MRVLISSLTARNPVSSSFAGSGKAQSRSSSDLRWDGQLASSRQPIVIRTFDWSMSSVERSRGECSGSVKPRSANIGFVRGFADPAGFVPAEVARQPGGGSKLKIDSAISDRHEFSTQTNRTSFSGINPGGCNSSNNSNSSDRWVGHSTRFDRWVPAWFPRPLQYVKR